MSSVSSAGQDAGGTRDVVIVGGGIAGLFCARSLAARGYTVTVLEGTARFGGRIETEQLRPAPFAGSPPHKAEFGPMRFELDIQPLFAKLLSDFGITTTPFSPPTSPEPPVEYPLAEDERGRDKTPLSSLELLKLGVFRLFQQEVFIAAGPRGAPTVELTAQGRRWLFGLSDANSGFDDLRRKALMPGTQKPLHEFGFWNALYSQLSPMAVAKILHFGTFYHLMPDNPNAAEWAIFWLRLFQLGDDALSTIDAGVQTVSDSLVAELERTDAVTLERNHHVIALRPASDERLVEIEVDSGRRFTGRHAILALPKQPLIELAAGFPEDIRQDLETVIAFPLLKVFCVIKTPRWWRREPPAAQAGAWNAPTRELHYLPAKPNDDEHWQPPDQTLVLLYTDRPAAAYWQPYLVNPTFHEAAECNKSPELKKALASILFNLHWEWAKNVAGLGNRTGRDALSSPKGRRIAWGLSEFFADIANAIDPNDPDWQRLGQAHPGLVGDPARILFRPEEVLEETHDEIGEYAIRDWSRPPYGAGCHAWAPGARSWEVRERLAGFSFDELPTVQNLHICGEAYSDYQGFIEGALRSSCDAVQKIVAAGGEHTP